MHTHMYLLCLQDISYEDITEAVEQFIVTFEPPLVPAKESRHKKIREEPPMYSKENRSHKVTKCNSNLTMYCSIIMIIAMAIVIDIIATCMADT